MKRTIIAIVFGLFLAGAVQAAVPSLINYQGYLKQSGVAVTGTKSITLSLYDAATGGSQLCTSGAQSVTVTNGLFSYKIGSAGCGLSAINWDSAVYLELTVEGTTLSPREQITGAAYSVETKAVNVEFTPAGGVAATDVQAAIEELDSEKLDKNGDGSGLTGVVASGGVAKTGDTMSGDLTVNANIITSGNITAATGTITAQAFAGDGSALTGITATDNTKVAKAGDTMSGALGISQSSATPSLYVTSAGTGNAIYGSTSGAGNAVLGETTGAGFAVVGDAYGSGHGVVGRVKTGGSGIPMFAYNTEPTNGNSSLYAANLGTGHLIAGNHSGASGNLLYLNSSDVNKFLVDKNGNVTAQGTFTGNGSGLSGVVASGAVAKTGDTMSGALGISQNATTSLYIDQTGATNPAGYFKIDNTISPFSPLQAYTNGTGHAGYFENDNPSNPNAAVVGITNGTGVGVHGKTTGSNASAGYFDIVNASNNQSALVANTTGTGNLLQLQQNSVNKFVVSNTGAVTATSFTGNGAGLTGVVASGAVAKTGDTMSGALGISQGGATATVYAYQTGTTNEAGYFEVNNTSSTTSALTGKTQGTSATSYGVYGEAAGAGKGVYGYNTSGSGYGVYGGSFGSGTGSYGGNSGTGYGILGENSSSGYGVYGANTGTGRAGYFETTNTANANDAVYITTNSNSSGGNGLLVENTGSGASAAHFKIDNPSNNASALSAETNGSGGYAVLGQNTGTGMAGAFFIVNASSDNMALAGTTGGTGRAGWFQNYNSNNATATVYILNNSTQAGSSLLVGNHSGSAGNLIKLQSGGVDKFVVNKTGAVTATSFTGDGSGLTSLNVSAVDHNTLSNLTTGDPHTQYVLGSGDTMSGALEIVQSTATPSLYVGQTGNGHVGKFVNTNATNNFSALRGDTNGGGPGVYGENTGTGSGAYGGKFRIINASNSASAIQAETDGTGTLLGGNHTGASGNLINLQSGGVDKFLVDINGFATATKMVGYTAGTDSAGYFEINNAVSNNRALYSTTNGMGTAIYGNHTGTGGNAGYFQINNAANASNALEATTNGTGRAINVTHTGTAGHAAYIELNNPSSNDNALYITSNANNRTLFVFNTAAGGAAADFRATTGVAAYFDNNSGDIISTGPGATLSAGGIWTNASSREYKTDITPFTNKDYVDALNKVKNIEIVRFKYKREDRVHVGLIAEDAPDEMVTDNKKGLYTADSTAMLIAAMQAQQAEIEALEAEIRELKGER